VKMNECWFGRMTLIPPLDSAAVHMSARCTPIQTLDSRRFAGRMRALCPRTGSIVQKLNGSVKDRRSKGFLQTTRGRNQIQALFLSQRLAPRFKHQPGLLCAVQIASPDDAGAQSPIRRNNVYELVLPQWKPMADANSAGAPIENSCGRYPGLWRIPLENDLRFAERSRFRPALDRLHGLNDGLQQ
jgi:hypothetical protein